jgi:phosphopantothenoylcysteine synthetase/decarboxylase
MRIWLDDERPMPQGFDKHFRTGEEVMDILTYSRSLITHIDFDHDLGKGITGYDVAHFIERLAEKRLVNPISWHVHSSNPVGSKRIEQAMKSAERFWYK